ncbi:MAG: CvpA family protein [Verrucomicrobiota bacterium]|jgi:uncharacterized membrane protein required for colicin V production
MCLAALPPQLARVKFDYFDIIVVVWLIIGLLRGRKRGMSQELLPVLQWVAIVVVAGMYYRPVSVQVRQYCQFDLLWSNIFAYILIGFGVHLVYLFLKHLFGEKLSGTDLFGRWEYYLGMVAGTVRFACMMLVVIALMHARIISKAEMAQTEKMQATNFSDIRFPTYGSIQQSVLFESFTGSLIESNLQSILIYPITPAQAQKRETLAHQKEQLLNEVMGGGKK